MLASYFVRSHVFHLICHPHIRSHCGVCMDNQVVHCVFPFSDSTYQYVAGCMEHAIRPLLHEHACTHDQYRINLQGVTKN